MKKKKMIKKVYVFILAIMLLLTVMAVCLMHKNANHHPLNDSQLQNLTYIQNDYQDSKYYKQHPQNYEVIIYNPTMSKGDT